jgi:hypothetical protein
MAIKSVQQRRRDRRDRDRANERRRQAENDAAIADKLAKEVEAEAKAEAKSATVILNYQSLIKKLGEQYDELKLKLEKWMDMLKRSREYGRVEHNKNEILIPTVKTEITDLNSRLKSESSRLGPKLHLSTWLIALLLFIIILFIYVIYYLLLVTYGIPTLFDITNKKIVEIMSSSRLGLFVVVFIFLFLFIEVVIYLFIFKGKNTHKSSLTVSICILGVVGSMFIFSGFDIFLRIFENTIGYNIACFMDTKLDALMKTLFIHRDYEKNGNKVFPGGGLSFKFLLSTFNLYNVNSILALIPEEPDKTSANETQNAQNGKHIYDFMRRRKYNDSFEWKETGIILSPEPNTSTESTESTATDPTKITNMSEPLLDREAEIKMKLFKKLSNSILLKNTVGHMCWTYFASIVTVLISLRHLATI